MNKEKERLLYYKELVRLTKKQAFKDFNHLLDELVDLDKKIDYKLNKLAKKGY